jgi:hypothetical protein
MAVSEKDYKEMKARQEANEASDEDNRLVRQYEKGDYDKTEAKEAEQADDTSDEIVDEEFDPNLHTVSEVNEYLNRLGDDEGDEFDRVVDAEVSGKNRAGIVGK